MRIDPFKEIPSESAPSGFVYIVSMHDDHADMDTPHYVKFGYAEDVMVRKYALQTSLPFDLHLIAHFPGTKEDEAEIHRRLKPYRIKREWFADCLEVDDFIDDLIDARFLLKMVHGDDYEPTIRECLDFENPRAAFAYFMVCYDRGAAMLRAASSEGP